MKKKNIMPLPYLELGIPKEREYAVSKYRVFFELVPNIFKALDKSVSMKVGIKTNNSDLIIDCLCKVSVEDFHEIILLAGNGYGHGAMKIVRGMFEKIVVARYFHAHPEKSESFKDYHVVKISKLGLNSVLKSIDPDGEVLAKFREGKAGGRKKIKSSWADIDFVKMAEDVGFGEDYVLLLYRLPNEFTHPSMSSILELLEIRKGKLQYKKNISQRNMAKIALNMGHILLLYILQLQIDHYKLNPDTRIFRQCVEEYEKIWPLKLNEIVENDVK